MLPSLPPFFRPLLALALALLAAGTAQAQLGVSLQIKRHTFMAHEPILATVVITNLTGRDVMLADTEEGGPWFSFNITSVEGRVMPPRNPNYQLEPLPIKSGETMKRTVNLTELYTLGDYGSYRVKASVFFPVIGKYFGSKLDHFDVMEGKALWKGTIGVPEGTDGAGEYRQVSLLTMEQQGGRMLYARIEDTDNNLVFCCYNLGRLVEGIQPDFKFDAGNNLAVLQLVGPKTYLLSRIGVNGNFIGQSTYVTPKSQPYLRKTPSGELQIVGAVRQERVAASSGPAEPPPKVSDRPAGF